MTIRRPIGESGGKTAFADRQSSERQSIGRRPETVHVPLGPSDRGEEEGEMGWKEGELEKRKEDGRREEERRRERRNKWTDAEKTQQRFKGERSRERKRKRRKEDRCVPNQGWLVGLRSRPVASRKEGELLLWWCFRRGWGCSIPKSQQGMLQHAIYI